MKNREKFKEEILDIACKSGRIKTLKPRRKGINPAIIIVDEWVSSPNAKSEADKFYRFLKRTTGGIKDEK